jgi:hypothetical protein
MGDVLDCDQFMVAMYRNTIAWLESHPHDFDSLANGPLGEALTADELRDLADEPESMPRFIEGLRESIAMHSKPTRWYVDGRKVETGESWGVTVSAPDESAALAKVLRRRLWAEWILQGDERTFAFTVRPA